MANKKNKVDKLSLPLVNFENKYLVRYRVVLDKNKPSDWSNIYAIPAKSISLVNGVTKYANGIINVAWENTNDLPKYDIFIKTTSSGTYIYHGSTISPNYTVIPTTGSTYAGVLVQAASYDRIVSSILKVYEGSDSWS